MNNNNYIKKKLNFTYFNNNINKKFFKFWNKSKIFLEILYNY